MLRTVRRRGQSLSVFLPKTRIENRVRGPQKAVGRCRSSNSKELTIYRTGGPVKTNQQQDFCYFVGIDISKDTLDWAVYTQQQGVILSIQTENTLKGIKSALTQLKVLPEWNPAQAVFCQEHTGIYNAHLLEFLHELKLSIWLESSLQIKQAGGMQRGKTDKVDAQRIAQYAYRFRDQMRLWHPPREVMQKLAFLSATRQRLNQAASAVRLQPAGGSSGRAGDIHQQNAPKDLER